MALVFVICLGVYYYLDNTVADNLNAGFCKREAQEQVGRQPLSALTVRDRGGEQDFYDLCIKDLETTSILSLLIKSTQGYTLDEFEE